jgi:arabinofuranosyltransferase
VLAPGCRYGSGFIVQEALPQVARRDGPGRRLLRAGPWWLLAATVLLCFAVAAFARRWTNEDAFINLRVVRNLLEGHGLVYNVGERVEAGTSPLWLGWLAALGILGLRLEYAAVYGGLLLGLLGLVLAGLAALSSLPVVDPTRRISDLRLVLPLGVGVIAVVPAVWDYVASGLETGLVLCWLAASYLLLVRLAARCAPGPGRRYSQPARLPPKRDFALAAVVVGLGPLVRPELSLHTAGFLLALCIGYWLALRPSPRAAARGFAALLAAACAAPAAYQVFRMGYFAALTPNTALAKEAFGTRWLQGYYYAQDLFGTYYLTIPLVALMLLWAQTLCALHRNRAWMMLAATTVLPACSVLHGVYVVKLGGDFMHGRMLLPVLFGLLLPVSVVSLRTASAGRLSQLLRVAACVVVVAWMPWCALGLRVPAENTHGIGDERGWQSRMAAVENPVRLRDHRRFLFYALGEQLLQAAAHGCPSGRFPPQAHPDQGCERSLFVLESYHHLPPRYRRYALTAGAHPDVVLAVGLGASGTAGYLMGSATHVVDIQGLTDPLAARMKLEQRQRPGHEKWLPWPWLVARFTAQPERESRLVGAARRALSCGELAELREATAAPLSWKLFRDNLGRAARLQRLRVPRDPFQAERHLCGRSRADEGG